MSYLPHRTCRACGYGPLLGPGFTKDKPNPDHLESVLDLGVMPLANAFTKDGQRRPGHYPVELLVCPRCTLGQLSATVDPNVLYAHYVYVTSKSQMMRDHFEKLWADLNQIRKIESVIEIGSNDGACLAMFRQWGARNVAGIDPAVNLAEQANKEGIQTFCGLFDREMAEMALYGMPEVDLVLARHVFCHVDDWCGFIHNIALLCKKQTLVCIEVPHAADMLRNCEWDTVYCEHLSYLTIKSMQYLLDGSALKLLRVLRYPVHGGAIALILARRDSEIPGDASVNRMLTEENCGLTDWRNFADRAKLQISELRSLVHELRAKGESVVGYGASAKSSVWVSACHFTRKDIAFIADCTPQKWWTMSPGTDIPILDDGALTRELPSYAVLWAWNYREEIINREKIFREKGGKWIVPVPKVEIV